MVQPKWLIEADVFGRSSDPVKEAIREHRLAYEIVHARPFLNNVVPEVAGKKLVDNDCVIFWGSPPLMRHLQLSHSTWKPGGWCSFSEFDCETYYPKLKSYLLNEECAIGTIDDLLQDSNEVFKRFARNSKVFVRPCVLEKVFTGQLVGLDDFPWLLERARYVGCKILVSSPINIVREWRVIAHGGIPIAASQYRHAGELEIQGGCPQTVTDFVRSIWQSIEWVPDELFVVDVAETAEGLKVIELNSFSCSGWYACDAKVIVGLASSIAAKTGDTQEANS